ncbi:hypothetical protein CAPTEDRAFT_223518 [Capitella teleta]|uniref:Death ligand signal enhancer n=2 Tax=Capitella teleta TaxID=283909 RepID=R7UEJ8_CAPTE|nr:hypothetical protein CAPTEDRAFT_223518 [Capitella teleta]|eukprot:ELU04399.1 hypothetical protein CAPTEDRAFT_223518 [Capitella teleta]
MWRIFQGIPRAFRTQWCNHARNAPQAVNHEEEAELEHSHCVRHPSLLYAPTHRFAIGDGNERKTGQAESDEDPHGFGHEERWKANRFKEWCDPDYCTQVEAFGWGAALLVSLRLSLGWQREQRAIYSRRDHHLFKKEAFAISALGSEHNLSTRNSILVETSTKYQENRLSYEPLIEEDVDLPSSQDSDARESVQRSFESVNENKEEVPVVKTTENDIKIVNSDPLKQALTDWESLTLLYTNMKHNRIATKLANKENYNEAFQLWEHASSKGYAKASYNLAICYETGKGVPQDMSQAAKLYHIAASQGCSKSLYNLSLMYMDGCGVTRDENKAKQLLEKAAASGLKQAQTELGVIYTEHKHRDMQKAASLFSWAAKQQDSAAQYYLGICYEQGLGVPCNPCKAAELYRQSANAGYLSAYHNLAKLFEQGAAGLPEDRNEALKLYEMAAKKGCASSQKALRDLKRDMERPLVKEERRKSTQPLSIYLSQVLSGFGEFGDLPLNMNSPSHSKQHDVLSAKHQRTSLGDGHEINVVSCT